MSYYRGPKFVVSDEARASLTEHTTNILKESLGQELWDKLWGPELMKLQKILDELYIQLFKSEIEKDIMIQDVGVRLLRLENYVNKNEEKKDGPPN